MAEPGRFSTMAMRSSFAVGASGPATCASGLGKSPAPIRDDNYLPGLAQYLENYAREKAARQKEGGRSKSSRSIIVLDRLRRCHKVKGSPARSVSSGRVELTLAAVSRGLGVGSVQCALSGKTLLKVTPLMVFATGLRPLGNIPSPSRRTAGKSRPLAAPCA